MNSEARKPSSKTKQTLLFGVPANNKKRKVENDVHVVASTSVTQPAGKAAKSDAATHVEKMIDLNGVKPLADQMRPNSLEDFVGQKQAVGQSTTLRSLLDANQIPSLILWGPPGCGKTTLAHIVATQNKSNEKYRFVKMSAISSGVADVKEAIKRAQNELKMFKRKTILFIDEIHRFNKLQQDAFLPHIEDGTITFFGATTENPSFQINNALLSRCRVITLEKLTVDDIENILKHALSQLDIGIVEDDCRIVEVRKMNKNMIKQAAVKNLAYLCDGDARSALNGLQVVVQSQIVKQSNTTDSDLGGFVVITEEHVKEGLQKAHLQYDRAGEDHYNCASAFQKSIRGSDENAAIYWLARMFEGGEDPLFIARRLVVCASEDIGVFHRYHLLYYGHTINLAQATVYLARAPKSIESYQAFKNARKAVVDWKGPLPPVPLHLRNAPTKLMSKLGYGKGYKYNPSFTEEVHQTYLPDEMIGTNFFNG
ncbi:ATPase WRNIP1-like isoform X2 [Tubulanus polymorphus]|uniref:ATPase WRNIP1-like isoform X2 n=1 Tax=Tubulanus polymorphus TaxID=672921 RepID=UPI003DA44748